MLTQEIEKVLRENVIKDEDSSGNYKVVGFGYTQATQALLELFKKVLPEEKECFCDILKVTVGDFKCPACIHNITLAEIKAKI